jgi:dienelactone hydrolase
MSPTRQRVVGVAAGVVTVLVALSAVRLGALERNGPAHDWLSIGGGIPGTLFLPEDFDDGVVPYQKPAGERPPVVIVAHGYSADQAIMSPLARSLAEAGYAVVTFDFRGHGSNTDHLEGDLKEDFADVVEWARHSPQVDGSRIAILGHSMGAGAALDYGTTDDDLLAVIPFSGGWQVNDDVAPANLLLIAAENDPEEIRDRQAEIADDLADTDSNVVTSTIEGRDHITVLFSSDAVREIVGFLDPVMGVERDGAVPGLDDARLRPAATYFLLATILIGFLGLLTAKVVDPAPSTATAGGLLLIAGSLFVTMPLMASGGFNVLPIGAGQPVLIQLLFAAAVLWGLRAFVRRGILAGPFDAWIGDSRWFPTRSELTTGAITGFGIVLLLQPLAGVTHRLVPTQERFLLWIVLAALALPFFTAFEGIVRRGGTWQAVGWGVAGRTILLVATVIGLGAGLLPAVIALVVPLLVLQYVLLEIFAASCYARGRNPAVIAVVETVFVSWIAITLTPIG